jgi:hypothetical protein
MTPVSAESKYDLQTLIKVLLAVVILGTAVYGAVSESWEQFIVCAPFAIALMPGYLELLPRGGMRHGSSCDCAELDAACELGFWFEHGQRGLLFLPLVLTSIFLSSFLQHDLRQALLETLMATGTAIIYSALCALGFYVLANR